MLVRIECPYCERHIATAQLRPPGQVEWQLTRHGTSKVRLKNGGVERRKTPFLLGPETAVYSLEDFADMIISTSCDRHPGSFVHGADVLKAVKRALAANKITIKASRPTGTAVITAVAGERPHP